MNYVSVVPVTPTLSISNNATTVLNTTVVTLTCNTMTSSSQTVKYTFYNNDTPMSKPSGATSTSQGATSPLNVYSCTATVGSATSSSSNVIRQSVVGKYINMMTTIHYV